MHYVTRDGLHIDVGRVRRELLDNLNIAEPVPPLRDVETWGGVIEKVPVLDDARYLAELFDYRLRLWREQLDIIATGLTLPDSPQIAAQLAELAEVIGPVRTDKAGFLRYCLNDGDRAAIVAEVLYQSTVTQRGIDEAVARFGYKWRGQKLETWHVPVSYGERGKLAVEWKAAIRSLMTWAQFCDLTGPEQSAHVAFWMLEDKLNYLLAQ